MDQKEKRDISKIDQGLLLDFYGQLLNPSTFDLLDLYVNQDYSITELAENEKISRQAIHERIQKGLAQLQRFEIALKLVEKWKRAKETLLDLQKELDLGNISTAKTLVEALLQSLDEE